LELDLLFSGWPIYLPVSSDLLFLSLMRSGGAEERRRRGLERESHPKGRLEGKRY
jgi:hypothetical protein